MNKCILTGRLTKDPEMRSTQSGVSVCSFSIAVNRRFKEKDGERKADFFNCVAWRQTGEYVNKYLAKGDAISVVGSMRNRSYQAQDGSTRYVTELIVDEAEGFGNSNRSTNENEYPQPSDEMQEVEDDELPF